MVRCINNQIKLGSCIRDMIKSDVYAICSYLALLMFLAKAIDKIDPTRGNTATTSEEIAIRPIFRSRY